MAALGTIAVHTIPAPPTRYPVADYDVKRGNALGAVGVYTLPDPPARVGPLTDYVVRQLRVVYRQLWPTHGQRFPQ